MKQGIPFWQTLDSSLRTRRSDGLFREPAVYHPVSSRLVLDRAGKELINFGSNDYLSLSWHPALGQAGTPQPETPPPAQPDCTGAVSPENAVAERRYGAGASPLLAGHTRSHDALRQSVAELEGTEDAVIYSSGYAANVGAVSALARANDVIFSDRLNHASLIDGCRLSRATTQIYDHCSVEHLGSLIRRHRSAGKNAFIVTDSLFSMDGDIAPLREIEQLAEEHDLLIIVDEAHATGVYGREGSGLVSELGCRSERWVKVGTFSKAIGCIGGFVAGNRTLVEWLWNFSRPYIYSTSMPMLNCESAAASIRQMRGMESERGALRAKSRQLRESLRAIGHRVGGVDSPIVAVYAPTIQSVVSWGEQLRRAGFYVPAIRPPTVPVDGSMLRISLNTSHTDADLESLAEAIRRISDA